MWQAVGASVQGACHTRLGIPCQDFHCIRPIGKIALVVAVADGLGSATQAEEGAKEVVHVTADTLEKALTEIPLENIKWEKILQDAFLSSRQSLERLAMESKSSLTEYSTTLIMLVVTEKWLAVGHIGDGAVVVLREDDILETLSTPQNGEYANETIPITSDHAFQHIRFFVQKNQAKAIAVFTDGIERLCMNLSNNVPFRPFFQPFFHGILHAPIHVESANRQIEEFLKSERVCSKTDDDKTIVIIGKIPSS